MRILFTSIRNTSHFTPLVPLIEASLRLGHEPLVAAPEELRERAVAAGAAFFPFGHPGDAKLAPLWAKVRELGGDAGGRVVLSEIFAGIDAEYALPELIASIERLRPALIVREAQEYAALIAGEKANVPVARCAISLSHLEAQFFDAVAGAIDVHRARLGSPLDPQGERLRREPVVTQLPLSYEDPAYAGPTDVRRFRAPLPQARELPDWWGGSEQPLLYVTFGTVVGTMEGLRGVYRVALDAVADLPVRVLLTTGSALSPESLGPLPANVHAERFVPQNDVLSHAAAELCHGGTGSVIGALSAGVPLVVLPMFADQPANAERVAAIGAGIGFAPQTPSADELREAVTRVLGEASFREAAARVAREIASLPSADQALAGLLASRQ